MKSSLMLKIAVLSLTFMGSLWQLEIADNCLLNGWQFKFLFNTLVFNDIWAVRDFFMILMIASWILLIIFLGQQELKA